MAGFCMHGVDDAGFCDHTFWAGLGERPTLQQVCERASEWLRGAHVSVGRDGEEEGDESRREAWRAAESHAYKKLCVVESYRRIAKCPALVCEMATLRAEWLEAPFRFLVGGGTGLPVGGGRGTAGAAGVAGAAEASEGIIPALLDGSQVAALLRAGAIEEVAAGSGIYAFDLFTDELCELLVAELDAFEATELPRRRPNTMNNAGLVVNEIGMHALMTSLLTAVVAPLSAHFYAGEVWAGARARARVSASHGIASRAGV